MKRYEPISSTFIKQNSNSRSYSGSGKCPIWRTINLVTRSQIPVTPHPVDLEQTAQPPGLAGSAVDVNLVLSPTLIQPLGVNLSFMSDVKEEMLIQINVALLKIPVMKGKEIVKLILNVGEV